MAVDTFQFYGFAVYVVIAACQSEFVSRSRSIFDFHFAETYGSRNGFYCFTFLVFQFCNECVEVGEFSRPFVGGLYVHDRFFRFYGFVRVHQIHSGRSNGIGNRSVFIRVQFISI